MSSYNGKLIRLNLTTGKSQVEEIPKPWLKDFIGGRGLGVKYLYEELKPGVEPLSAENKVIMMMGPLGATTAMSVSRMALATKSPLTGAVSKSIMGGSFGAFLKFAGYDGIIVEGKSEKPVYLHIDKEGIHLLDAADLWGLDTQQTHQKLREKHGKSTQVACIGPAGENLVRYSILISDLRCGGRTGVGTVLGAKKIKAFAVNSSGPLSLHDADGFKKLTKEIIEGLKTSPGRIKMSDFGTSYLTLSLEKDGIFPIKNFQEGHLEGVEKIGDEALASIKIKNDGCYGCMTKCGQVREIKGGTYDGAVSEGPDYETIWSLGGNLANTDIGALIAADSLCDKLGLDTVSAGNSIGFAYELYQRGIITKEDTDGLELKWGDPAPMMTLIQKISDREGLGKLLGEGTKRAAAHIGKGAEDYAMQVKGLELPAYEPRAVKGYGLIFATSNVGAHHMYGRPRAELAGKKDKLTEVDKGQDAADAQTSQATQDSVIQCSFSPVTGFNAQQRSELLVAATGFKEFADPEYVEKVGERTLCLERCFNVREGFDRKDDALPKRMRTEPLKDAGPATGQVYKNLDGLLDEYYDILGYTRQGIPSEAKLKELGLDSVVADMKKFSK
jgi:aldehyde:ferredoxin oxidoreductase